MKICIVTSSFRRYDGDYAGQHVYAQAVGLSRKHDVYIVYPTDRNNTDTARDPFHHCAFSYPFKTYPMAQVSGVDIVNVSRLFTRMRREIKKVKLEHGIDLFYAFWAIPSAFICSLACGETPFIVSLAGLDDKVFGRGGIARPFIKHALSRAAKIITLSNELRLDAMATGVWEENISVIPSGIDLDKYKLRDKTALRADLGLPGGFLFLYVGSLFKLKRIDWLIRLSAELGQTHRFHSLIVGDGPEKENLKEMAVQLNAHNVHFLGNIPYNEVPLYMSASDARVLFSETEGLPSCVQEALASGIPAVATNVGGVADIVHNGVTGYVVNSENEARERLTQLLESPLLAPRMGANARIFAEDYLSHDRVLERVNTVCESVISSEYHSPTNSAETGSPELSRAVVPVKKSNIGMVSTFPADFLSCLIEVQSPYADQIHVVAPALQRDDANFHLIKYDVGKNTFSQILNQVTSQFRMSYEVARLGKKVDFWIITGGDVFALPILTARILGIPVMLSLLGNLEYETALRKNVLNPVQRFMRRINCTLADRILVLSAGLVKKWHLDKHKKKILVAQSQYVDLERFKIKTPFSKRNRLVGYVGRLSPEKGVWNLVQSVPLVLQQDTEVKFLMIGDGPLYDSIEEYLETAGLDGHVRLAGKVPYGEIPNLMNELSLLVLPSFSEGLPNTILEAMACGTPVLATPVGGVGEIITSGKTGFLLEDNSPEVTAKAIMKAINNPGVEDIAVRARRLAETDYSLLAARGNYQKVILEGNILSGNRNKRSVMEH